MKDSPVERYDQHCLEEGAIICISIEKNAPVEPRYRNADAVRTQYPEAKLAPDGFFYVTVDGKWHRVVEE
jgi:hypothetical protein